MTTDLTVRDRRPRNSLAWLFRGASLTLMIASLLVTGCKIEKVDPSASLDASANSDSSSTQDDNESATAVKTADGKNIKVAYITNCVASFWVIAEKGCKDAAKDLGVECSVKMPPQLSAELQNRIIEETIASGFDGVAISPVDPANQRQLLNTIGENTNLITHDSDAPESNRLAYIGMSNYDAGRMCGKLVKEALPDGGEVVMFVGTLGQLNADQRRQGVIDELLDRSVDSSRAFEPNTGPIKGDKYTIVDTRTDDGDPARGKSNAEDAMVRYPKIGCMVGLFAYNPPGILEAVRGAGKIGEVQVVGFDEEAPTLQAIVDGDCYGTVVQNPYQYGYKSVEMLTQLASGDQSVLPEGKFIDIPARAIRKDNVNEFWTQLKQLTSTSEASPTGK